MIQFSTASAPGKIHLIGEHSSVYGKPAILAAINKRVFVKIQKASKKAKPTGALFAIQKYLYKKYKTPLESFEVKTFGDLPVGRGLGSSAAFSAALTACLFDYYKLEFDLEAIFKASYEGEKFFHGNPSGGDLAACVYGGAIYFRKETESIKLIKKITPKKRLQFAVIDSGKPKETTKEMVQKVSYLPRKILEKFCHDQEILTKKMAEEIVIGSDFSDTLKSAGKNLEIIGVVSPTAKKIMRKLYSQGFSAKISGGGGVREGSGMILVLEPNKFNTLGNKILTLKIEDEGVRKEK